MVFRFFKFNDDYDKSDLLCIYETKNCDGFLKYLNVMKKNEFAICLLDKWYSITDIIGHYGGNSKEDLFGTDVYLQEWFW